MLYRCSIRIRNPHRRHPEPAEVWRDVDMDAPNGWLAAEFAKDSVRREHPGCRVTCHRIIQAPEDAQAVNAIEQAVDTVDEALDTLEATVDQLAEPPKRRPGRPRKAA